MSVNTALYLPERVRKMVLISPAATFAHMWPFYWHYFVAYILSTIGSTRLLLDAYEWIWQGFPRDDCITQLRLITAEAGWMRHGAPTVFSDEELRKIQTPALLLIGDHEVIYNPERVIQRVTRLVPGLRAEIIPKANHNAEYTAPDIVNTKILGFLAAQRHALGQTQDQKEGHLRERWIVNDEISDTWFYGPLRRERQERSSAA